tara:strand:+ start:80 stop:1201 length:1122 start_codon:yes stop_codon:yes gene_type:complete
MLLNNFYIFLGIINPSSLVFYENKYEKKTITNDNNICFINYLFYFYQICILCLLIFNPLYYFIYNTNINSIGFIFYKLNYLFQYIFLYINFNKILKYKYFTNNNFYNILLFSQIFLSIIYAVFLYINYIFKPLFYSNYLLINILLYISDFYGFIIYLNSILLFILIFTKLLQDIYILNENLIDNINNNNNKGLIKFFHNIINLKNTFTNTINDFNHILNIFTLINLISLGLLYHIYFNLLQTEKIFFFILLVFFIIIEIICLSIILFISKIRTNIFNKIYNPLFINNFIKKYDINTFNDNFDIELDINDINITNTIIYNILEENSTSIDWIILNITLHSKWIDFDLCGFKIYSINCITKIISIIAIFYKIINL